MNRFLQRIFQIYPDELKLFLWVLAIQFTMRMSTNMLNNYAQTAFLKRFGVEYLPTIFVINSLTVFFVANAVGVLMDRSRVTRVFTGLLLFYALCVGTIRFLLPANITLLYPVLFIIKTQSMSTLPLLYMNILNTLFTARQSKRLFSLITAGGVLGGTLGSLMTATVAGWLGMDNILLVFVGGLILAASLNEQTEWVIGAPIQPGRRRRRKQGNLKDIARDVRNLSRRSPFIKYLILIIAIPNFILPIINFQFNVVVDETYAAEGDTLRFFGLFRGVLNAATFAALMISARFLRRYGVGTSLLVHPINYFFAFAALLLRYDIISAWYARLSKDVLNISLHVPSRAVLYNFIPADVRGRVQVFLRGTVTKAAGLAGSGLLVLLRESVEPRLLSLVALPFVLLWIFTQFQIKRKYSAMLIQVLLDRQIEWRALEAVDLREMVKDKRSLETLERGLREESDDVALLCGELLAQTAPPGWASTIVRALDKRPPDIQRALLDLLPVEAAKDVAAELVTQIRLAPVESIIHLLPAVGRLDPAGGLDLIRDLIDHPDKRVRAQALMALYCNEDPRARDLFRRHFLDLRASVRNDEVRAPLDVMGKTGDPEFSKLLLHWVHSDDRELASIALCGLGRTDPSGALKIALEAVTDPSPHLRRAAMEVISASGQDTPVDAWIGLLADEDEAVRNLARQEIRSRGQTIVAQLIPHLASPSRALREEILKVLEAFESHPVELSQFVNRELERAYENLAHIRSLLHVPNSRAVPLLRIHLAETNREILETILRVLSIEEIKDRMDIIRRAIQTGDKRDMDNAVEALEGALHAGIRKNLIPLLEESPLEEKVSVGRKRLGIRFSGREPPEKTLQHLLTDQDPVTMALALYGIGEIGKELSLDGRALPAVDGGERIVVEALQWALNRRNDREGGDEDGGDRLVGLDKVIHIKKIPILSNLKIRELFAVADISGVRRFEPGEVIVREGDPGDVLYLVIQGNLSVIKAMETPAQRVLARVQPEDFFGEMALFEREPRSASVVADTGGTLLMIEEGTFNRIMEAYPSIPINICRAFSRRTRALHERLQTGAKKNAHLPR